MSFRATLPQRRLVHPRHALFGEAQEAGKVVRIGYLSGGGAASKAAVPRARRRGLRYRGWQHMLIFVVARSRLDRYEELRRQVEDWRDVRIVLDRREGERRTPDHTFSGVDPRRAERRQRLPGEPYLKLGWTVVDPDELVS